ncbi:hypothetical protein ABKN59_012039 [Abortiporus biennis]
MKPIDPSFITSIYNGVCSMTAEGSLSLACDQRWKQRCVFLWAWVKLRSGTVRRIVQGYIGVPCLKFSRLNDKLHYRLQYWKNFRQPSGFS